MAVFGTVEPPGQQLSGRAAIDVVFGDLDEVLLAEPPFSVGTAGQWLWRAPSALDVGQLRLGRLTGCGDPVIVPSTIVDGYRVGHHSLDFGCSGTRRGTRLTGADGFTRKVEAVSPEGIECFRRGLAGQPCEFFRLGLSHFPPPSAGWVSKMRSPSGSVIQSCLLRVQ